MTKADYRIPPNWVSREEFDPFEWPVSVAKLVFEAFPQWRAEIVRQALLSHEYFGRSTLTLPAPVVSGILRRNLPKNDHLNCTCWLQERPGVISQGNNVIWQTGALTVHNWLISAIGPETLDKWDAMEEVFWRVHLKKSYESQSPLPPAFEAAPRAWRWGFSLSSHAYEGLLAKQELLYGALSDYGVWTDEYRWR